MPCPVTPAPGCGVCTIRMLRPSVPPSRLVVRRLILWGIAAAAGLVPPLLQADTPALLAEAVKTWESSGQDLAFTQRMVLYDKDKNVKETRVARYDPSRPDSERWQLLEVDGKAPAEQERTKWEDAKNRRPRNRGGLSPSSYLDLPNARLVEETADSACFEAAVRKDKARFVATEQLAIRLEVDKKNHAITHVSALLRQPMNIALGLARVTDLDLDLPIEAALGGAVDPDASARLTLTKFGQPTEFTWSQFSRVESHPDAAKAGK